MMPEEGIGGRMESSPEGVDPARVADPMPNDRFARLLAGLLLPAAALAAEPPAADAGPDVRLSPLPEVRCGQPLPIEVDIRDDDGVFDPRLYVRPQGAARFAAVTLREGASGLYRAVIPADEVERGVDFYVEAFDNQGNGPARSGSLDAPHRFDCHRAPADEPAAVEGAAPAIVHTPVARAVAGRSIPIEASFRGPSGLYAPTLYFRRVGTPSFTAQSLVELPVAGTAEAPPDVLRGPAGSGRFVAEVPAALTTGDVEYYLEAMDTQGNGPSTDGTRERPHVVRVVEPVPEPVAVDPQLALDACLSTSEAAVEPARLGPCRVEPTGLSAAVLASHAWAVEQLHEGRAQAAVSTWMDVVQRAPEWPAGWFRLGQAHEASSAWKAARDAWERYLELVPTAPEKAALVKRLARLQKELKREA
ncbi:MAG: hypothetical protein RL199_442, partial [Pseudomonadota bacterium]